MTDNNEKIRSIAGITGSIETFEGGGFPVRRPFPKSALAEFDPFLLLDEMGPVDYAPGQAKGAPDHPHRGFETVTYVLAGRMEHKDSQGHSGQLGTGDVQWMTAGAGVVHSEMPEREFLRSGGVMHGFQLWVNLPARDKMMKPRYQEIPGPGIPVVRSDDGLVTVRVVAGESLGSSAVIETRTPITYLHINVRPGGRIVQALPEGHNAFAYVIDGQGVFGAEEETAGAGKMVLFNRDGNGVSIAVPAGTPAALDLLLIAGEPLGEPIARYGPFVMNNEAEIRQAIEDYRAGRMGEINL